MSAGWHLPLSPVDSLLQPPGWYLQVQDTLIIASGILWTLTYVLYLRQGLKDQSYGMPMFCLCANIAWELLYGVIWPNSAAQVVSFAPWLITDFGLVYITVKFGGHQWRNSPLLAKRIPSLLGLGILIAITAHWTFKASCAELNDASFYSAWVCQVLLSVSSVVHLLTRGNTSGHSWAIWYCRWIGSVFAESLFFWRYFHYPEAYPIMEKPFTIFIFALTEVADVTYGFVYKALEEGENKKAE